MKTLFLGLWMAAWAMAAEPARITSLMTKELKDLPGKEAVLISVDDAPGGSDPVHRHNAHTFVYVLEGTIIMQVRGRKEVIVGPGQTFYESPNDVHLVGRNASASKPAKFLVFFVKEQGKPLLLSSP